MAKAVLETGFWKERVQTAVKRHYMVYVTSEGDWVHLNDEHKKILSKEIPTAARVLDAGCGYGRWATYFSPKKYTGVDFSPDLLDIARRDYPQYTFDEASLLALPYADHQFDVAFCVSIKRMIENNTPEHVWPAMEKELKRVAKKVLILEYEDPKNYLVL